jgi:hypothetical protein
MTEEFCLQEAAHRPTHVQAALRMPQQSIAEPELQVLHQYYALPVLLYA